MSIRMAVRRLPAVWMKQVRWDEYDGGTCDKRRNNISKKFENLPSTPVRIWKK